MRQLRQYGDQVWQKGMEQAKLLLDKQPQLKKLVEENKQKLLREGDLKQLWQKVSDAAKSGNMDDLQAFVKEQVEKASKSSGGWRWWDRAIPRQDSRRFRYRAEVTTATRPESEARPGGREVGQVRGG